MKKYLEDEVIRGFMIALLGVLMLIVVGEYDPYGIWGREKRLPMPDLWISFIIVAGIGLFAMIMRSSGHYRGKEFITPNYFDSFSLEVYIFFDCLLFLVGMATYGIFNEWIRPMAIIGLGICYLSRIFFCMSFAVRCKAGTLLTNTLVYRSYDKVKNFFVKIINTIKFYISNIPFYWQVIVVTAVCMLLYGSGGPGELLAIGMAFCFAMYICGVSIAYGNIEKGIEKIVGGDTEYQIDTSKMPLIMKKQAENLNNINTVVSSAVQKRIKSEQFRTELITNVSHDIKTPLTSIINYIDLMDKENITRQPMADYISVLKRQSNRLKKLIDDLVEASKASTGNIAINLATTDLKILLNQAVAEYLDRAENSGLEISLTLPEKEIYVLSDGRLLWRVFDNLLNNACKYSLTGTRIYSELYVKDEKAVIVFKNISKTQLNISPDELMERFVRGDSSRNTEGSGLGLSIAQSLTELLGGVMKLEIDGDMFKTILEFDVI